MASWEVHVSKAQATLGQFSHELEEAPMVGQEFEIDWDIPGGRIPRGKYQITSVNVHCFHIVIEPTTENLATAEAAAAKSEPEGN